MNPYELVVLDMNGTTVRDNGLVEHAVRTTIAQVAPEALDDNEEFSRRFHEGRGAAKLGLFERITGDHEKAVQALSLFDDSLVSAIRDGAATPIEGAVEAITSIRDNGLRVVLTTGFSKVVRDALIDEFGWRDLVDLALGPEESGRGRPAPDIVLTAALSIRVDNVRHIVVAGDTRNDLLAGNRAGAGFVCGVLTGAHSRTELETIRHDAILDSIQQLPAAII